MARTRYSQRNTGNVNADEIVQVYVSPVDRKSHLKPVQLQGFARVSLNVGESQTVSLKLFPEQLGYFEDGWWHIDPGHYLIKVASSSQDIRLI